MGKKAAMKCPDGRRRRKTGREDGGLSAAAWLTCLGFGLHPADPLAHGDEGVVVLLQALVGLLVQASKGSELRPVELLELGVKDHAKGGDHAVEVGLLPASPPGRQQEGEGLRSVFGRRRSTT